MSTLSSDTEMLQPSPTYQTQTQLSTNISVQDLQGLISAVELACQRGAFRASELSQVGTVYDKINQFIQNVKTVQTAQNTTQQPSEPRVNSSMPMTPPFSPKVG